MHLKYKETRQLAEAENRASKHISPHLHDALEIICVTSGTLELGVGQELYHMEEGDVGIVFPDVIHHCQVFGNTENYAIHIKVSNTVIGMVFADELQKKAPLYPIIKKSDIGKEVNDAIAAIMNTGDEGFTIVQAYIQIILAKCLPKFELVDKTSVGSTDLVYQTVSYISTHFREHITLESMAIDLGVSKYILSRVFSGTFHRNFNQYLNDARLNYACRRLEDTNDRILDICLESGFDSQRTFNRVFKERFRVPPIEYRKNQRDKIYHMANESTQLHVPADHL